MCVPYTTSRLFANCQIAVTCDDKGINSACIGGPCAANDVALLRRRGAGHTVDPGLEVRYDFRPVDLVEHLMACVPYTCHDPSVRPPSRYRSLNSCNPL